MYTLIIPVYKNEESIPALLTSIARMNESLDSPLEVVFVVDGSPDRSYELLAKGLGEQKYSSKLLAHSRNFGSFAAIRSGLSAGSGLYYAVMAADLQEPPELILNFFSVLKNKEVEIVVGKRMGREDPFFTKLFSSMFWSIYQKMVQKNMPEGGVDVFGCSRRVRDLILSMEEANSSLIGLLFWVGFKTEEIPYRRLKREHGKGAWSFSAKVRYFSNSIFSFTDLPIRILIYGGVVIMGGSTIYSVIVLFAKFTNSISIQGYSSTLILILFGLGLNSFGLGLIGSYVWRTFENTKLRPHAVLVSETTFRDGRRDSIL